MASGIASAQNDLEMSVRQTDPATKWQFWTMANPKEVVVIHRGHWFCPSDLERYCKVQSGGRMDRAWVRGSYHSLFTFLEL